VRLTAFGFKSIAFYLAMLGAFLASPYSNLFFLLLAFLTLLFAGGAVSTWRNLRGVTAHIPELPPAPAGAGHSLRAQAGAPSRARFQVSVQLELEGAGTASGHAALVSGEQQLTLRLPALPRGLYAVRRARVASSYPLGVFARRREVEAPAECIVYPAPVALATVRSGAEALSQLASANSAQRGDLQPSGLREFKSGDEGRAVHWRASARLGALVVKEWESGSGNGLEISLDRRCAAELLEEALSQISALIEVARTHKEVLALSSQGLRATFGDGHRPWREALRFLAETDVLPADGAAPPVVSPAVTRLPMDRREAACAR
jgi:uncharacterized protein (DUF58 family)